MILSLASISQFQVICLFINFHFGNLKSVVCSYLIPLNEVPLIRDFSLINSDADNHFTDYLLHHFMLQDHYSDVTLFCEGVKFPVHKLVLSSCSEYFNSLFQKLTEKNIVVVLRDIKQHHLRALLSYIYVGEVNVSQDELPALIKAAEELRIKGLATATEDEETETCKATDKQSRRRKRNNEDTNEYNTRSNSKKSAVSGGIGSESSSATKKAHFEYEQELLLSPSIAHGDGPPNIVQDSSQSDNSIPFISEVSMDNLFEYI